METLSVCLLASGELGCVALSHLRSKSHAVIHSVFTDKKSDGIIAFCEAHTIPCFAGNPRNGATAEFRQSLGNRPCVILSVNYLFLIEDDLISYPTRYAVNIHGSLLPKYRGRTPHVWAIINNEKKTGITAHLITTECDTGAVISQIEIPILDTDTGGSIIKKYTAAYPTLIDDVLENIANDTLQAVEQDESKATYFPKRTPDDGEIDFSWQKERIYNWVRAMAPPEYPGAFFYDGNDKVIVSKAAFCDDGFALGTENGAIISRSENAYIIKTPNGCVKAVVYDRIVWGGGGGM